MSTFKMCFDIEADVNALVAAAAAGTEVIERRRGFPNCWEVDVSGDDQAARDAVKADLEGRGATGFVWL